VFNCSQCGAGINPQYCGDSGSDWLCEDCMKTQRLTAPTPPADTPSVDAGVRMRVVLKIEETFRIVSLGKHDPHVLELADAIIPLVAEEAAGLLEARAKELILGIENTDESEQKALGFDYNFSQHRALQQGAAAIRAKLGGGT